MNHMPAFAPDQWAAAGLIRARQLPVAAFTAMNDTLSKEQGAHVRGV
jgi:hypothetical protein